MQMNPHLNFNGQCAEAFKFYEQVLGGKILTMVTHGDTPAAEHVPAQWRDKIVHATMMVGDQVLMGADAPPDRYEQPKGISLSISVNDPADARRIFDALARNGTVRMALEKTFWAAQFGMLVDRFGIPWMVNCEQAA